MARVLRGLLLTAGVYSLLICAYVIARVVLNGINPGDEFITGIAVSFWDLGIVTFNVGVACMVLAAVSGGVRRASRRKEATDDG